MNGIWTSEDYSGLNYSLQLNRLHDRNVKDDSELLGDDDESWHIRIFRLEQNLSSNIKGYIYWKQGQDNIKLNNVKLG